MRWGEARERVIDGVTVLDVQGDRVLEEGNSRLREQIDRLLAAGRRDFLLNMEGVRLIDSKGLADVIGCYIAVSGQGGRLKLCTVAPQIQRLLVQMRLRMIEMYDSEAAAVPSFLMEPSQISPQPGRPA